MKAIISNDDIKKIAYTLLDLFIGAGLWDDMRIYFLFCRQILLFQFTVIFTRHSAEYGNRIIL